MYDREKSDPAIVAVKLTNKAGQPAAESVEPRAGAEGNVSLAKHGPGAVPGNRVTGAEAHTARRENIAKRRHAPEVGAVCPNWARTDLCGGREVTRVPTANQGHSATCRTVRAMSAVASNSRHWMRRSHPVICQHAPWWIFRVRGSVTPLAGIDESGSPGGLSLDDRGKSYLASRRRSYAAALSKCRSSRGDFPVHLRQA